jgi:hypothetical protein
VRCSRQPQVTDEHVRAAAAQLGFPFLSPSYRSCPR